MGQTVKIESLNTISKGIHEIIELLGLRDITHQINCLAFYGQMGAGKTTIIKELCKALHVKDTTASPSFSLINEYVTENGKIIYHFDFYRINKKEEAFDLGYEEYFYSDKLCLIEWPEKIESLLPVPYVRIDIEVMDRNCRLLHIDQVH